MCMVAVALPISIVIFRFVINTDDSYSMHVPFINFIDRHLHMHQDLNCIRVYWGARLEPVDLDAPPAWSTFWIVTGGLGVAGSTRGGVIVTGCLVPAPGRAGATTGTVTRGWNPRFCFIVHGYPSFVITDDCSPDFISTLNSRCRRWLGPEP